MPASGRAGATHGTYRKTTENETTLCHMCFNRSHAHAPPVPAKQPGPAMAGSGNFKSAHMQTSTNKLCWRHCASFARQHLWIYACRFTSKIYIGHMRAYMSYIARRASGRASKAALKSCKRCLDERMEPNTQQTNPPAPHRPADLCHAAVDSPENISM